jgi:sn-glycerol 3-phosphate transport system substrate-binding protein
MQFKQLAMAAAVAATTFSAQAVTEIQWWHSMTAVNNEWVNDLAKQFNESQKDYKVVPTKGVYDESMTAAIAPSARAMPLTSCRCLKWALPP